MADFDFQGTTALVTGASSGIGLEIARVLAREVQTIVLLARREERLRALAEDLRAERPELTVEVCAVDLADRAALGERLDALEARGVRIDVLVNNAGFGDRGRIGERPWPKLEKMLEVNVVSATYLVCRLVPGMIARGKGAILNVGSIAGIVPKPGSAIYGSSKAYLNLLSEAMTSELAGTGVTVTAVLPGPVPTEFGEVATSGGDSGASQTTDRAVKVPRVFHVDAAECAKQAVRALGRGQPRIVPGAAVKVLAWTMDNLPRRVLRPGLAAAGKRGRTK